MDNGKFDKNGATKILQNLARNEKGDFGQLNAYNPQSVGTEKSQTEDPDIYLNIHHEMHIKTKTDCLFFQSLRLLQSTDLHLLQNQYEQKELKF